MNKDSIIKILVITIIVLLLINIAMLAVWGIVSIATGTSLLGPSRPADKEPPKQTDTENIPAGPAPDTSAMLGQTPDMGQDYIDKIIFLGDSTTYHMLHRGELTGGRDSTQVWTGAEIKKDENNATVVKEAGTLTLNESTTYTLLYYPKTGEGLTLAQAVAKEKPEYMVITLGVNGISSVDLNDDKTVQSFIKYYRAVIMAIQKANPDTKIMLQSIFPVTEGYSQNGIGITNQKIDAANGWIMQLAKDTGCKYLDTASVLKNDNGALPSAYDNGDGYHLSTSAYSAVFQYIRTHGYTE